MDLKNGRDEGAILSDRENESQATVLRRDARAPSRRFADGDRGGRWLGWVSMLSRRRRAPPARGLVNGSGLLRQARDLAALGLSPGYSRAFQGERRDLRARSRRRSHRCAHGRRWAWPRAVAAQRSALLALLLDSVSGRLQRQLLQERAGDPVHLQGHQRDLAQPRAARAAGGRHLHPAPSSCSRETRVCWPTNTTKPRSSRRSRSSRSS